MVPPMDRPPSLPLDCAAYYLARNGQSRRIPWWETCTASVVVDCVRAGANLTVLAGLIELLREGVDPDWLVGGQGATAAVAVAREWVDAGVEPTEVAGWFRTGCYEATAATRLIALGLRPHRLLDEDGHPLHWVTRAGERVPLGQAVAEFRLAPEDAVRAVVGRVAELAMP